MLEECDAPEEFYYDAVQQRLYYSFNSSAGEPPPAGLTWEAPQARQLFALRGSMRDPVRNVALRGLELRDTRSTSLDPHGMPSGEP